MIQVMSCSMDYVAADGRLLRRSGRRIRVYFDGVYAAFGIPRGSASPRMRQAKCAVDMALLDCMLRCCQGSHELLVSGIAAPLATAHPMSCRTRYFPRFRGWLSRSRGRTIGSLPARELSLADAPCIPQSCPQGPVAPSGALIQLITRAQGLSRINTGWLVLPSWCSSSPINRVADVVCRPPVIARACLVWPFRWLPAASCPARTPRVIEPRTMGAGRARASASTRNVLAASYHGPQRKVGIPNATPYV